MRRTTVWTLCLFLAGLLVTTAASGQDPRVLRTIPDSSYDEGDILAVTLNAAVLDVDVDIEETIPANFDIVDDGGGTVSGQTLGFTVPASGGNTPPTITEAVRGGTSTFPVPVVVEAGLFDGAEVFNDRTHVFASVAGTIVDGSTYVQVANDDKNTADYSLDVTVDQDTVLYVIVDDRVGDGDNATPPTLTAALTWLPVLEGFQDTGATIGIDENNDGSINQTYTIYSVDIEADSPLTLGAQNDGGDRNMYSVAVPPGAPPVTFTYQIEATGCEPGFVNISGLATAAGGGEAAVEGDSLLNCVAPCPSTPESEGAELVWAFTFGSRELFCPVPNEPDETYTTVLHVDGAPLGLAYPDPDIQLAAGQIYPDEEREWGFEILYQDPSLVFVDDPNLIASPFGDRAGFGIFGPFDDSPNNRNVFGDDLDPCGTDRMYDSFIGAKDFTSECSELVIGDRTTPCDSLLTPEGIIFRVDVPNGTYKFVVAVGDADNTHAHRILAENGGAGTPDLIEEHVVLISNHDQAQYDIGNGGGNGVYGATGFGDKVPPPAQGMDPTPKFIFHDSDGLSTNGCPDSPALEVTEGYIRIHALQGNSNDGPGGGRDANGGDLVVLEIWSVEGGGGPTGDRFARGDADANGGAPNITDGIYVLNFLFLGGPAPPCRDAADADDNGDVNITDGIYVLNFLFLGGPAPPAPQAPTCGEDETADALGCESFPPCE